jgi:zinc transporter 13
MNQTASEWIGFIKFGQQIGGSSKENTWLYAAICSALVGLSGLFPILFVPSQQKTKQQQLNNNSSKEDEDEEKVKESNWLRWMLSFAVGSLLGDVFLHLLPEAYNEVESHEDYTKVGLYVLLGMLTFIIVEKIFNAKLKNGGKETGAISVTGYLNLVANCVDNFSHGLAVGGAFLVSNKVGFVTTACILVHEIPHEVGDFAILMKSGFTRYEAAKAQFSTAFVGIFGAIVALALDSWTNLSGVTFVIVPFTCGGFLHIALVSVLPDLLISDSLTDCFRIISGIVLGIVTMMAASSL